MTMTARIFARTGATCVTTEWIAGRTGGILTATAATSARTFATATIKMLALIGAISAATDAT